MTKVDTVLCPKKHHLHSVHNKIFLYKLYLRHTNTKDCLKKQAGDRWKRQEEGFSRSMNLRGPLSGLNKCFSFT